MKKCECKHCVCLIEENGKWCCDELGKPICEIIQCPEMEDKEKLIPVEF